jgi:hypothetical protein
VRIAPTTLAVVYTRPVVAFFCHGSCLALPCFSSLRSDALLPLHTMCMQVFWDSVSRA